MHSLSTSSAGGEERKGGASCYSDSSLELDRREQAAVPARRGRGMTPQGWPLQGLLLLLVGASALDVHLGTTVTPHSPNYFLEEGLWLVVENYDRMMKNPKAYPVFQEAAYGFQAKDCWDRFAQQMANVSALHLCEWSIVRRPYAALTYCLEGQADKLEYGYPNALAENYILWSHRLYFLNCTLERPLLLDPPENILLTLIITPICLIPLLVTLVVLKSKDGEMQA